MATQADGGPDAGTNGERLECATGEYRPDQDWHEAHRFDNAEEIDNSDGTETEPNGRVNEQSTVDASGTALNFVHSIAIDEAWDDAYLASLCTTEAGNDVLPCTQFDVECGPVAVIAYVDSMDGQPS